ncbi:SusC/RagA family TonB-linked outer membrane protein [Mucilaginibacter sp. P19]|uniref:SusC/RagA family TonB-linked outer membrane protein n=1 Tax=Mucilaginibacter sp. P19 TaxID=3423947 RepID=UPI003D67889C
MGGDKNTTFSIGGNFHSETTILPGENLYQRGGIRYNIQHRSINNKFSITLSGVYNVDANHLVNPVFSYKSDIFMPPNFPLTNSDGSINWQYGLNPLADINARLKVRTDNFLTNLVLKYNILNNLDFNTSIGYNKVNINQVQTFPLSSQNPKNSPVNYSYFADNANQSVIVEPTLNFTRRIGLSTLNILAGSTYQSSLNTGQSIDASQFSSDQLLENLASAGVIRSISNSYLQYKYISFFGRVNYNIDNKYIFNGTIRRDGSSRFGPGNQFGTFGSVGAAWLFSQESWFKETLPFISYGKLRGSYGIVGNDQISDYQYLSTFINYGLNYQNVAGLQPYTVANADFHWEVNRKLEFAIELGLFKDRLLLTAGRYQNRSSNQLVAYAIPTVTGFSSYQANLPAVVQNTGWEFELNTKNIQQKNFSWTTSFNITLPKNTLVSFQNFANSSYSKTLAIGEDITRIYGYHINLIDPATGKVIYATEPGSTSTSPYFYTTNGKQTPAFYGGFGNSFTYKNWQLDIFGQFTKQMSRGDMTSTPGNYRNNYLYALNRWQNPGDIASVPKASRTSDARFSGSSGDFFDASYLRLKNISFSYSLPAKSLSRIGIDRLRIYAEGQNVYTWWHKSNPFLDPETGKNLPPLRSIVLGTQLSF